MEILSTGVAAHDEALHCLWEGRVSWLSGTKSIEKNPLMDSDVDSFNMAAAFSCSTSLLKVLKSL